MKLFARLFRRSTRSDDVGRGAPRVMGSSVRYSPELALTFAAVYGAVRAIATTTGTIPFKVRERTDRGNQDAKHHPLYRLMKVSPHPLMTPADFFEASVIALLLRGENYVYLDRGRDGNVRRFVWLHPDRVRKVPSDDGQELLFEVDGRRRYDRGAIWYTKGLTRDGVNGITPIQYVADTIDAGIAAQASARAIMHNTGMPSGVLQITQGKASEDEKKALAKSFTESFAGPGAGGVLVTDKSLEFKTMAISLADKQYIETRKLTREDISAIYGVPLFLLGTPGDTHKNIQELQESFLVLGLRPWLVKLEQSFNKDVLLDSEQERYFGSFHFDAILRVDILKRMQANHLQVQMGALSPNEVRRQDDKLDRPGGDVYFEPLNMAHVRNGEVVYDGSKGQQPAPTEPGKLADIPYSEGTDG